MKRPAICAALAAALVTIPAAALAEPPAAASQAAVYNDVDLGAEPGAVAMMKRISRAATAVCSRQAERSGADAMARFETCHRETVARAAAQLGAPEVLAAYEARPTRQG